MDNLYAHVGMLISKRSCCYLTFCAEVNAKEFVVSEHSSGGQVKTVVVLLVVPYVFVLCSLLFLWIKH